MNGRWSHNKNAFLLDPQSKHKSQHQRTLLCRSLQSFTFHISYAWFSGSMEDAFMLAFLCCLQQQTTRKSVAGVVPFGEMQKVFKPDPIAQYCKPGKFTNQQTLNNLASCYFLFRFIPISVSCAHIFLPWVMEGQKRVKKLTQKYFAQARPVTTTLPTQLSLLTNLYHLPRSALLPSVFGI